MDELKQNTAEVGGQVINRAYNVDQTIDNAPDPTDQFLTITLETIDSAIMYYFENVIKPQVVENGAIVRVPVMYGSQEKWKSIRQDGFIRDNKGRLITPLIMFKRNSVAKDTNIPIDKLDANSPQLYYTIQRKHTQKNRYDNFNVLTGQVPVREYYNVVVPDYIVATYDVILWTTYVKQMNSLVESMIYASDAYWGDSAKWRFRTQVSDIATPVEVSNDADRTVRGTLSLSVNGYLVPNTLNAVLSRAGNEVKKSLSVKKIVLMTEVDNIPSDIFSSAPRDVKQPINVTVSTVPPVVGGGSSGGGGSAPALTQMLTYLNKQFVKQATTVAPTTATFSGAVIATPPGEYPITQSIVESFLFFVNGQFIEKSAIISFAPNTNPVLTIDAVALGFSFDSNDEVVAVGKFDA